MLNITNTTNFTLHYYAGIMLSMIHYAQNYAGIIGGSLVIAK